MINYSTYFSNEKIINSIVSLRAEAAFKKHDEYFLKEFNHNTSSLKPIYSYTPPRRLWLTPPPEVRNDLSILKQTKWSIEKTIYRYYNGNRDWNNKLKILVSNIQRRAFSTQEINKPYISFIPKDNIYSRPLAVYDLEDQIFISLTAKYFTDLFDTIFSKYAIAFRSKNFQKQTHIYNYHQIIQNLINYRKQYSDIWVSECDIKSFYDTVNHETIRGLIDNYNIDLRAKQTLLNYLDSYTFFDVINKANQSNKQIKYPLDDLSKYYESIPKQIGIAQGGALSCFLSNLVLSEVDKQLDTHLTNKDHYYRYCDDMILLTTNESRGKLLFDSYIEGLKELKLPYHKPIDSPYSKQWYSVKTKVNYKWSKQYPYISYLGYQLKYNSTIRIRKKSIDKEKQQHIDYIDKILEAIKGKRKEINPIKFMIKIKSRWFKRILGLSYINFNKAPNFAWSNGFKLLANNQLDITQIKELDRHWNKQIIRIKEYLFVKKTDIKKYQFHYLGSYMSSFKGYKYKKKSKEL